MDKHFALLLGCVIIGTLIGLSLEAINPHRKPEGKITPGIAAVAWAVGLSAIVTFLQ